jgi:hypothetical protein
MKVRYIGDYYKVVLDKSKTYEVKSVTNDGLYEIYVDAYEDYFLFNPADFEILSPESKGE